MKVLFNFITAIIFSVILGPVAGAVFGVDAGVGVLGMLGLSVVQSFIPMPAGLAFFAVQKEIWSKHIEETLYDDIGFLDFAFNADDNVIGGRVVHIPQSGGPGNVEKNRETLPANIRRRGDTDIVYALNEYTSDPVLIENADKKELSYNKRESVISEDRDNLSQTVAEDFLYAWAKELPAESILETSGGAVAATAPGATGDRLAATLADLQKAQTKLNKQLVPKKDRYAMVPSEMLAQIFPANDAVVATYMRNVSEEERKQGVIAFVHGFKILERGTALIYANDGTLKVPEAVSATDDDEAILCWQKNSVERAKGTVEFFADEGKPEYYGDVYSMLVRAGGRRRREDNKGVVTIKQKKSA